MLIHGAWHGGWCWDRVAGMLRERGHTVLCPDLPGHGSDDTPPGEVTMSSYTGTVGTVLGGLSEPAVLVGHSFGGAVVSQVCEARPYSVGLAVYLAAFLLRDRESVWRHGFPSQAAPGAARGVISRENLRIDEQTGRVDLDPAVIPEGFYSGCPPEQVARAMERWRPEPLAPLKTPLSLTTERFGRVPRAYIRCSADAVIPARTQDRMVRLSPCRPELNVDSGHSPFLSQPAEVAGLLLDLADLL